ncbi:putative poly(beta-d-mannuronate) o-acetylase [hydrocarbon metagenome]|uniref:Putative poly(Beta-d-mannuronate) o-acetylase n=1 Tax=hydrocarbon metagenome TaxID=938273 RepID=A0A0W8E6S2_9ZZZZ
MLLNSLSYALFIIVLFIAYWFLVPTSLRSNLLLAASFFLLLYLFPTHTILILLLSSIVYLAGELIAPNRSRGRDWIFLLAISGVLGILAYYKYLPLLAQTIDYFNLLAYYGMQFALPTAVIPIGISFFTFRFIHYLIEVKRGTIENRAYLKFLNYTFFFPIIVAGPIERYDRFAHQAENNRKFKWEYLNQGLPRIILGLFKKIVLADSLSIMAAGLGSPDLDATGYLLALYAYTFKIYFDFSGYSDIAVGTGRLFGFRIMENFDAPYLQRNISLFWKKWHMSLTRWFMDYVFIPLGGSRGTLGRTILNTFIVMMVTGLWHGAAWHFVFWGLYHASGLIVFRLYTRYIALHLGEKFKQSKAVTILSTVVTFNFTALGWIFFVNGISQSINVLRVIFHVN